MTATPRSLSDFDQIKPEKMLKAEKQPADSEPKPKKATPPPLPKSPLKRELKPLKPLSEPPKPKPTAPPSEPPPPKPRAAAPPPKAATPPRPVTPLPQFISQFKGAEWFEKYFPNANENVSIVLYLTANLDLQITMHCNVQFETCSGRF